MAISEDFRVQFGAAFSDEEIELVSVFKYKQYYNFDYGLTDKRDVAILTCIAHLLTVRRFKDQPVAPETQVTIGAIQKTYQTPDDGDWNRFFNSTQYGQQFLLMIGFDAGGVFV